MKRTHAVIVTQSAQHLFPADKRSIPGIAKDAQPAIIFPTANKEGLYRFPDDEAYLRIPGLRQVEQATVVHSGYPDPNGGLIELFMTLSILRQYAPKLRHTHVIFTSMPYARQDKAWYDGELNMAKTLIDMIDLKFGVSVISTIDAHFAHESWAREYSELINVSAVEHLLDKATADHADIVFVTPDAGAQRRINIKLAAGAKKKRSNSFDVSVMLDEKFAAVIKGKTVGVVDDLVSTGTTLVRFAEQARKLGAKKVVALLTHGVGEKGISLIQREFDGLYLTNSINRAEANVNVRSLIDTCIVSVQPQ